MSRTRVLPYKQGSKSAKALAETLNGKVLKIEGSSFVPISGDVIVNWGRSDNTLQTVWGTSARVLNLPEVVKTASNKKSFLSLMEAEGLISLIPEYWTDKEAIPVEKFPILCRTILNGHSGAGICWADTPSDLVDSSLYVRYIKKSDEYRVHVSVNGVFLVQRKARRLDYSEPDWRIRNHDNGFIYQRSNIDPPACVISSAVEAFKATNLDFGAVDVIYNKHHGKAYVLEINTAPGLAGSTVTDYANMIKGLIE